jgi:L-amino acid N-acyltransferase YncA
VESRLSIRGLDASDWPAVRAIWEEGIATGQATFEGSTPSWAEFEQSRYPGELRLVGELDGVVVGWAALAPASQRGCYAGVAEHSVYVTERARGTGVGEALMRALLDNAQRAGIWTVQTSVFPGNRASLALHERLGFRVVGHRERIAQLEGVWRDTVFLELRFPDP